MLHGLEILLAGLAIAVVFIGSYYFVGQLLDVATAANTAANTVANIDVRLTLQGLLADLLILVVGVELAIMLIKRTPESLIEIMFFCGGSQADCQK